MVLSLKEIRELEYNGDYLKLVGAYQRDPSNAILRDRLARMFPYYMLDNALPVCDYKWYLESHLFHGETVISPLSTYLKIVNSMKVVELSKNIFYYDHQPWPEVIINNLPSHLCTLFDLPLGKMTVGLHNENNGLFFNCKIYEDRPPEVTEYSDNNMQMIYDSREMCDNLAKRIWEHANGQ